MKRGDLTIEEIKKIRKLHIDGRNDRSIGREFNVSYIVICNVLNGSYETKIAQKENKKREKALKKSQHISDNLKDKKLKAKIKREVAIIRLVLIDIGRSIAERNGIKYIVQ